MLRNFRRCYVFHWFKWKEYSKLLEICFPNVHRAANMLHAIYLWNMFHSVRRALWNMSYILLCSLCQSPFVNKRLSTEQLKRNIQPFDNPIHNPLWYTMLYIHSRWIPILFVVKTTLVHQLPTLHAMCAFALHQDGVFSYLQCSWIVQELFEPRISFITCSNNIWQPFFALLKNCYAWTMLFSQGTLQV